MYTLHEPNCKEADHKFHLVLNNFKNKKQTIFCIQLNFNPLNFNIMSWFHKVSFLSYCEYVLGCEGKIIKDISAQNSSSKGLGFLNPKLLPFPSYLAGT